MSTDVHDITVTMRVKRRDGETKRAELVDVELALIEAISSVALTAGEREVAYEIDSVWTEDVTEVAT